MFFKYITLASGANFLLLSILLLLKKSPNRKSNAFLVALFLLMAAYCSFVALHYSDMERQYYNILRYYTPVDSLLLLLMGPCLYCYVLSVLNKRIQLFRVVNLLHVLPFILYLRFCVYFFSLTTEQRSDWLIRDFHSGSFETNLLNTVIYTQIIVYLLVCRRRINKQLKLSDTVQFENTRFNISWLKLYLNITLGFVLLTLPLCFVFANERTGIIIGQTAMNIQFVYMFFKWTLYNESPPMMNCDEAEDTRTTALKQNTDTINAQFEKLMAFMADKKPYLNDNCSIVTLSAQTGIPQYQLTNLISCKLQKNFPDFINQYRVEAAHELLLCNGTVNSTIEFIASECGFGSKSAFNRAFKKFSQDLTPTEFIKQHKNK
jgi:AraC-like DNA-binding protein